jgi:SEFIR domain
VRSTFVDLPNANVSFELGYALGSAKQVAFARVRPDLPAWLNKPPLNGFICEKADTPEEIRNLISSERWVNPSKPPVPGDRVLLLCPHRSGSAFLEEIDAGWGWQQTEKHGWDLHNVPNLFSGIGRVVWIIAPHDEGSIGRDGEENAALAILAGYAHAQRLPIDIFQQTDTATRVVVDVISQQQPFSTIDQLVFLLKAIADEQERIVAERSAARSIDDGRLERSRIFISYSHDSSEHCDRVLALAQQLRRDGINAELDQFHQDQEELKHWPRWCEEQLRPETLTLCSASARRNTSAESMAGFRPI